MYKNIRQTFLSLLLGVLVVLGLVYGGIIERGIIFCIPFILIGLIKGFVIRDIKGIIVALLVGILCSNIGLLIYYSDIFTGEEYVKAENRENTAIVLLTDGEPVRYDVGGILKNTYNGKSVKNKILAPLTAYKYKRAYERMGSSKYNEISIGIREDLIERLRINYDVLLYYYEDVPYIYKDIDRLSRSYDKIIICPIAMGYTYQYEKLEKLIDMRLINNNSSITKLPFLWQSKKLMRGMYLSITKEIPSYKAHMSGVVLLLSEDVGLYEQTIFASELTQRLTNYGIDKKDILPVVLKDDYKDFKKALNLLAGKDIFDVVVINIGSVENKVLNKRAAEEIIKYEKENRNMKIDYISGWGISDELMDEIEYEIRINNLK